MLTNEKLVSGLESHESAIASQLPNAAAVAQNPVMIEVDFSKLTGRIRSLQQVHAGPIPPAPGAAQLHEQYKRIGVDYVRSHDVWVAYDIDVIFRNMQADPSNELNYNFSSTDLQVVAVKSVGAEVFYRLGYSWGGPSYPPGNYTKFAEICKRIVMHYNQGWANGFKYGIRYWEIWNEADFKQFWTGTPEQYFRLYDVVARALKTVDRNLKVGGPALAGPQEFVNRWFLDDFLRFCKMNESPLDFVSWHIYTEGGGPQFVAQRAYQVQQMLKQYGFDNVENILSEWNMYVLDENRWRPEFWNARGAAWAASALIYLESSPISKSFWYRGDSGGIFGLFSENGTFKKTGYVYLAMRKMLDTPVRLACTGSNNAGFATLAGKTREGDMVAVLISDFDANFDSFTLKLGNHTWQGKTVRCEMYLLDDANNLALIEKSEQPTSMSITISRRIAASSVYLIILEAAEKATMQTSARSAVTTTAPKTETGVGPAFTQTFLPVFVVGAIVALTALVVLRRGRKAILGQSTS
jgi:hypothetical protein